MDKIVALFASRRVYAVVAGILVVVLHEGIGLDETQALEIVTLVGAWVLGDTFRPTA